MGIVSEGTSEETGEGNRMMERKRNAEERGGAWRSARECDRNWQKAECFYTGKFVS
jgi:hypothetical protein